MLCYTYININVTHKTRLTFNRMLLTKSDATAMHLTKRQKYALIGLAAISILDITLTLWGFYTLQIFEEANPLLKPFARWTPPYPIIFPFALAFSKIAVISLIVALTAWFNTWDHDRLSGGNICSYGAFSINAIFFAGLAIANSTRFII